MFGHLKDMPARTTKDVLSSVNLTLDPSWRATALTGTKQYRKSLQGKGKKYLLSNTSIDASVKKQGL